MSKETRDILLIGGAGDGSIVSVPETAETAVVASDRINEYRIHPELPVAVAPGLDQVPDQAVTRFCTVTGMRRPEASEALDRLILRNRRAVQEPVPPIRYLTTSEFAERLGLKDRSSLPKNLPEPDALVGTKRGWLPATIDRWNAERPGHGGRPPKAK